LRRRKELEEEKRIQRKQIEQQVGRGRVEKHGGICDVILLRESNIKRTCWFGKLPLHPFDFSFVPRHCYV
jgi:hypothetical protein